MKERTNPRDLEQLLANNVCTKRWEEPAGPSAEVLGGQTDAGEESQVGQLDD